MRGQNRLWARLEAKGPTDPRFDTEILEAWQNALAAMLEQNHGRADIDVFI